VRSIEKWNVLGGQVVEVSEKFVAITTHLVDVACKLGRADAEVAKQISFEASRIRDGLRSEVVALLIAEELALSRTAVSRKLLSTVSQNCGLLRVRLPCRGAVDLSSS
jgi:hypothetical protein